MKVFLTTLLLIFLNLTSFAQEVSSVHTIQKINETNEYSITTTISGLEGVDLAKVEYQIPDKHSYKASPKNTFFSDRKENILRFYLMAIPTNGIVVIEYNLVVNETNSVSFPVLFQYSKNEEKNKINLTPLIIELENKIANKEDSEKIKEEVKITSTTEESESTQQNEEEITKNIAEETTKVKEKNETSETVENEKKQKIEVAKNNTGSITNNTKNTEEKSTGTKYGVQLFALSEYSQVKVFSYCKKYNLDYNKITTKQINGLTKVWYGKLDSASAAQQLKQELINKGITGIFIVTIP